eukprot:TRINITY_DN5511_c0_g1_i1.p1 TRINITY_DN5511_c0_g1~~TRINITY_DN5511_c0_g1_i1.p1  ORF type:complete len:140 (-),score=7.15 TRINITY_DN5511_c0_g1_i1:257-676(-)
MSAMFFTAVLSVCAVVGIFLYRYSADALARQKWSYLTKLRALRRQVRSLEEENCDLISDEYDRVDYIHGPCRALCRVCQRTFLEPEFADEPCAQCQRHNALMRQDRAFSRANYIADCANANRFIVSAPPRRPTPPRTRA